MADHNPFAAIVHRSKKMADLIQLAWKAAETDAVVMITGESGTGKELFARAIHDASARRQRPFVAINCAAIPENLLESELFGHERGAFTGADRMRRGRFEQANTGTLFLDEIGDMSSSAQAKILRVLETRTIERVGGQETIPVDIRVITATNQPLWQRVNEKRFRGDLFYRLNEVHLDIPPLVDRREDIPVLAAHLVAMLNRKLGKRVTGLSDSALALLSRHDWPGNVRELEHMIKRAMLVVSHGQIWIEHLPIETRLKSDRAFPREPDAGLQPGGLELIALDELEKRHIKAILGHVSWNRTRAAKILGISRPTLLRKIGNYRLTRPADLRAADGPR
jgi:transcriptional regulator with PAS, ATPase and Fis domain